MYPTENVIKLKCQSEITNTSKGIQELGRHISKTTTTVFLWFDKIDKTRTKLPIDLH